MNILSVEKQANILALLTEGCSIRSVERLTKTHRDTITRLALRTGENASVLHDRLFWGLTCREVQIDELWSFVGKKEARCRGTERQEQGDQYTFLAQDAGSKAILGYHVGKRTKESTSLFISDLRKRFIRLPTIMSDAFPAYADTVREEFGEAVNYGQVTKMYASGGNGRAYGVAVKVTKDVISGNVDNISTNSVERLNLSFRMQSRRFTRKTNGFSKTLRHHHASVALYTAFYNFCRPHESLGGMTPAMAIGKVHHAWKITELMEPVLPIEGRRVGSFTVIDGGLS